MKADVEKIKESLNRKIKKAGTDLKSKGVKHGKGDVYAHANLTDQEILVLAAIKVNNERGSLCWEGFVRSDEENDKAIDRRFETIKKIIAKSPYRAPEREITNPEIIDAIEKAERGEGIPWELPKPKNDKGA